MSSRASERLLRAEFILLKNLDAEQILRDFGLIIAAGLLSQAIAALLRLPEMVVLVAVGALILFHGGTGISLRVLSRTAVDVGLLVLPGVFLTGCMVALAVALVFGVPFSVALMVGAVLAATTRDEEHCQMVRGQMVRELGLKSYMWWYH